MSGAEVALIGLSAGGTGMNVFGQISAAKKQQQAAEQNAALKNMQADELLSREAVNEDIIRQRSGIEQSQYASQAAASGAEGGGIGGLLTMRKNLADNLASTRRDAEFKARMLRAGADIETGLASDIMTSAYLSSAGTILTSGANTWMNLRGPSGTANGLGTRGSSGRTG